MNNEQNSAELSPLEPLLQAAVKEALAGPIHQDAIERVKARARQMANPHVPASRPLNDVRRRRASRTLLMAATVAAALIVVVAASLLLSGYSGGRAFAQMVDKVRAARTVRFNTSTRLGKGQETTGVMYLEDNRMRFEQFDDTLVVVVDLDHKQGLLLDTRRKLAQLTEITAGPAQQLCDPIDQLRRAAGDHADEIGQEIIAGRRTQVYRLHKVDLLGIKGRGEMTVWVDVASELPAKILIRDPDPKAPSEFRFEDFQWNEPYDHRLFSLSLPEGFQKGVIANSPFPKEPAEASPSSAENPNYFADGILSRDRVPAEIVWGPQGNTLTALVRDPESVQPTDRRENELRQWDVTTGKLRWSAKVRGADSLAASPDGKRLAIVIGYEVQIRDAASGKIMQTWAAEERLSPLAFSPDGKRLAAGITEWGRFGGRGGKEWGGVQFWNIEQASLARSISDDKPTTFLRYSPDGKHLATSSNAGPVKLWDAASGDLARIFPGIYQADFSPDGQTIACQIAGAPANKTVGRVDLFRLRDGSLVRSFSSEKGASTSWLCSIALSPDGRLLAAADWNGTVTLWDIASGERRLTIADDKAGVLSVAFAPKGTMFATGSEDKTLRVRKVPARDER
jgi:outer membrane lipoprotein-sorting protein